MGVYLLRTRIHRGCQETQVLIDSKSPILQAAGVTIPVYMGTVLPCSLLLPLLWALPICSRSGWKDAERDAPTISVPVAAGTM